MSAEAATTTTTQKQEEVTQKEVTQGADVTQVDGTPGGEKEKGKEKGKENEDQKEEKGNEKEEKGEKEKGKGKGKGKNKKGAEEDEEEEEGGKKKKAKKGGGGGEDHRMLFEIGEKKRATVNEFKGAIYVDIREFYNDKEDGSMKPTKKGISLKKEEWKMLCECAKKIDEQLAVMEG
jgi:hypothetical protein